MAGAGFACGSVGFGCGDGVGVLGSGGEERGRVGRRWRRWWRWSLESGHEVDEV